MKKLKSIIRSNDLANPGACLVFWHTKWRPLASGRIVAKPAVFRAEIPQSLFDFADFHRVEIRLERRPALDAAVSNMADDCMRPAGPAPAFAAMPQCGPNR